MSNTPEWLKNVVPNRKGILARAKGQGHQRDTKKNIREDAKALRELINAVENQDNVPELPTVEVAKDKKERFGIPHGTKYGDLEQHIEQMKQVAKDLHDLGQLTSSSQNQTP